MVVLSMQLACCYAFVDCYFAPPPPILFSLDGSVVWVFVGSVEGVVDGWCVRDCVIRLTVLI